MSVLYIDKNSCSCCGHKIVRWPGYPHTDNEGSLCKRCHIQLLRKYVLEIEKSKELIGAALSPVNRERWDRMNSQEKKIIVFRYMEAGLITYTISNKKAA